VGAFEAANYKRLVLQLKVAICSVLKPLLRDRKFVLPAVAKLGGAYPAHCILPRFSVSESYLEYEIYFGTLTHAPRVATEVEGRYLILGKDTESRSALIILAEFLFVECVSNRGAKLTTCVKSQDQVSYLTTLSSAKIM
jgi:hypothetical protein